MNHDEEMRGLPSGFVALDRMTGGWRKGDLIIVGARPDMGKTAFALTMARNIAVDFKKPIAFFELESSAVEVVSRLISSESRIKGEKLNKGDLTDAEWSQLTTKVDSLAAARLFIDDTPDQTMPELRAKCLQLKEQHDLGMVIIDQLLLVRGGSEYKGNGSRAQETRWVLHQLNCLAKELHIPIMVLSPLSRQGGNARRRQAPQMSDFQEFGAIEQEADMVMFIYRPEYYKILEDPETHESTVGKAFILIEQAPGGNRGVVRLRWDKDCLRFENDTPSPS